MISAELVQVDAFTSEPFRGNPAAVCILESEAPTSWMQSMAEEMNLSETAFVWPDERIWGLRWFTPVSEVRLCGHATLGAAHALWETGRAPAARGRLRFRTQAGILDVRREASHPPYRLALPRIGLDPLEDDELSKSLQARMIFRTSGPGDPDVVALLHSAGAVREFEPDLPLLRKKRVGLIVTAAAESSDDADFVSRYFAPFWGIAEDPVTGSAHAALFPFWIERLGRQPLRARQLSARGGELEGRLDGTRVLVGGDAVTIFRGLLSTLAAPPRLRA